MSARERQTCRLMGRVCCGIGAGQLAHAAAAPLPPVAATTLPATIAPSPPAEALPWKAPLAPMAAAAIVQGIGLFTLFTVFLI